MPINYLAKLVKEATGSSSPLRYISYEEAYDQTFEDMPRRVPDLSRIRAAIGYAPTKKLDQIVDAVVRSSTMKMAVSDKPVAYPASCHYLNLCDQ